MAARSTARQRLGSIVLLALLTALSVVFVTTAAAGARRTVSSMDRFRDATDGADFVVLARDFDLGEQIAEMPGVDAVGGFMYVPFAPDRPGVVPTENAGGFASMDDVYGRDVYRIRVLEGRTADPDEAGEFTANEEMVKLAGLELGEEVDLVSVDPSLVDKATLVGIHASEFDYGANAGNASALFTRSFFDKWSPELLERFPEQLLPSFGVLLDDAEVGSESFEAALNERFGADNIVIPASSQVKPVEDGLRVQSTALWLLAGVAAFAALLVLGQFGSRIVASSTQDGATLTALGLTSWHRAAILTVAPAVALVVGAIAGAIAAIPASALMPIGYAERIEPAPGVRVDVPIAALVPLGLALAVIAVVAVAAIRRAGRATARSVKAPRVPGVASVALTVGIRNVRGGASPEGRAAARSAVGAAILGIAGVIAVLTFMSSQEHLLGTPAVHGWQFDAFIGSELGDPLDEQLAIAEADERVERYGYAIGTRLVINDSAIDGFAFVSVRGSVFPTVIEGREPTSADELLLGAALAERLGLAIGDTAEVAGEGEAQTKRIVGIGAIPALGDGDFGETLVLSEDGLEGLGGEEVQVAMLADFAPGVTAADVGIAPVGEQGEEVVPYLPVSLLNLERAGDLPAVLGLFLAGLAVAAVAHALLVVARRNRRDIAVLRTMGFVRRQVVRAVTVQAAIYALVGVVVGAPLGFVVGRLAWSAVARDLGVQQVVSAPFLAFLLVALAALVVANGASLVPARVSASVRPAEVLRTE